MPNMDPFCSMLNLDFMQNLVTEYIKSTKATRGGPTGKLVEILLPTAIRLI